MTDHLALVLTAIGTLVGSLVAVCALIGAFLRDIRAEFRAAHETLVRVLDTLTNRVDDQEGRLRVIEDRQQRTVRP